MTDAELRRMLRAAMPADPRGWWTGEESDEFISEWQRRPLPEIVLQDASSEVLTLWCVDAQGASDRLGIGYDDGFELTRGEYVVCVVQADER